MTAPASSARRWRRPRARDADAGHRTASTTRWPPPSTCSRPRPGDPERRRAPDAPPARDGVRELQTMHPTQRSGAAYSCACLDVDPGTLCSRGASRARGQMGRSVRDGGRNLAPVTSNDRSAGEEGGDRRGAFSNHQTCRLSFLSMPFPSVSFLLVCFQTAWPLDPSPEARPRPGATTSACHPAALTSAEGRRTPPAEGWDLREAWGVTALRTVSFSLLPLLCRGRWVTPGR